MSQINQNQFYFCDNIGKCGPILVILSLLHSVINCKKCSSISSSIQ